MATGRINLKTIDYHRFKKLIIDGNRDDYSSCSKEIKAFCDYVQTFNFRDEQFDEDTDRCRFEEICCFYRQILSSKRINPIDMRLKSGWWGDNKGTYSIGKIKPSALKDLLIIKAKDFAKRQGASEKQLATLGKKIDGPGIFVFKHKERHCFQYVGRADKVIARCAEKLKCAYEGTSHEPLAALFLITLAADWEFYFTPIQEKDEETLLHILENDIILRHDCIWPHGLNFVVHIDSLLEVSEFRKSCLRHNWPPEGDKIENVINLDRIRQDIQSIKAQELMTEPMYELQSEATSSAASSRRSSITDVEVGGSAFEDGIDLPAVDTDETDRPASPLSMNSTATYTVELINNRPPADHNASKAAKATNKALASKENIRTPRSTSATKAKPSTRAPSGSPKKQRRPDWRGPLDKSESGSTVSGSNGTPKSQAHTEWKGPLEEEEDHNEGLIEDITPPAELWTVDMAGTTVEVAGMTVAPERPTDLPLKNQKLPSTPKKIPVRCSAGKKRL